LAAVYWRSEGTKTVDLTDPSTATLTIAKALEVAGIRAAVYGGLALAAYGEARETKDAHFAVAGISAASSVAALTAARLAPTLTFEEVRFGGNRTITTSLAAWP
jgi:hypothetical protein